MAKSIKSTSRSSLVGRYLQGRSTRKMQASNRSFFKGTLSLVAGGVASFVPGLQSMAPVAFGYGAYKLADSALQHTASSRLATRAARMDRAISASRTTAARMAAMRANKGLRSMPAMRANTARRSAAQKKTGDGQTDGYYRQQAGRRVFVKGYTTPSR